MHPGSHRDTVENGRLQAFVPFRFFSAFVSARRCCFIDRPLSWCAWLGGPSVFSVPAQDVITGHRGAAVYQLVWSEQNTVWTGICVQHCILMWQTVCECLRWMLGFVQGLLDGLGHVVELSWSPSGTGLIVIFAFWSVEMNSFFICQK